MSKMRTIKTTCFAYKQLNGKSACTALSELVCASGECSFFKESPIEEHKLIDNFRNHNNKNPKGYYGIQR